MEECHKIRKKGIRALARLVYVNGSIEKVSTLNALAYPHEDFEMEERGDGYMELVTAVGDEVFFYDVDRSNAEA